MYKPVLDAVGGSLLLTALVAMLPFITLCVMLGALRTTAWKAAIASLVVAILVAVIRYSMPSGQARLAGSAAAPLRLFPILRIAEPAMRVSNSASLQTHSSTELAESSPLLTANSASSVTCSNPSHRHPSSQSSQPQRPPRAALWWRLWQSARGENGPCARRRPS